MPRWHGWSSLLMPTQAPISLGELLVDDSGKNRQFVTALARGLEVLRCFERGDGLLGNQEIASRTGLPRPTVSRLTYTLTRLGYLEHVHRLGKYRLGTAVLSLGYALLNNTDLRQTLSPLMQELAEYADASVALGARDRLHLVYLENCRSSATLTLGLEVGSRIPIATTAMTAPRREGDHYILNGTKRFITNAPEAGIFTVMARTD